MSVRRRPRSQLIISTAVCITVTGLFDESGLREKTGVVKNTITISAWCNSNVIYFHSRIKGLMNLAGFKAKFNSKEEACMYIGGEHTT